MANLTEINVNGVTYNIGQDSIKITKEIKVGYADTFPLQIAKGIEPEDPSSDDYYIDISPTINNYSELTATRFNPISFNDSNYDTYMKNNVEALKKHTVRFSARSTGYASASSYIGVVFKEFEFNGEKKYGLSAGNENSSSTGAQTGITVAILGGLTKNETGSTVSCYARSHISFFVFNTETQAFDTLEIDWTQVNGNSGTVSNGAYYYGDGNSFFIPYKYILCGITVHKFKRNKNEW